MCGIWGVINIADEYMAEVAARAMYHRGPDDYGIYVSREPVPVSLANTRLAIIDLSGAGHQPMPNENGRYWIVYNGEMYNFQPLRTVLMEAGHSFRSNSDTEVILHAYEEWGEKCLDHFRGMFAFAIWDTVEAKLFAARDRLGIKPLYYVLGRNTSGGRTLAFGSELKTLLASTSAERKFNLAALHHYLAFYSVPTPYTMLQGVEALPPGYYLTFQDSKLNLHQYWDVPPMDQPLALSEDEIREQLRALLEESIRLRMIADVPVAAFLSGGIDSSAVVALMTRISGERLKTFSIGFGSEGQTIDERSGAKELAHYYDTDHTEIVITGRDVCHQIDRIITSMDQPSGDGINTYFVSQAAAAHVKVALSGLGGDELFAGYPQFKMLQQAERVTGLWQKLPGIAQSATRGMASILGPVRRVVTWLDGSLLERYERVRVLFNESSKLNLYTHESISAIGALEASLNTLTRYTHPTETNPIAQISRLELKNYMAHTLLRDTDAMSMAHSLEVRVPLIDHKLVEFAARIPSGMKLRNGRTKWIFIEALKDILPANILNRPKQGFELPMGHWMRNELRPIIEDTLSKESVEGRGLFRPEVVKRIYQDFLDGREVYMHPWTLVVLELWMRRFVDGLAF